MLALVTLVTLVAGACGSPERADLVLTGGRVFTADSARPWAEAIAVRGDRILAVGTDSAILALAGDETRRIPLGGRTVVPGFNDAHTHLGAGIGGEVVHMTPAPMPDPSFADVRDSLDALRRRIPSGVWIRADIGGRILADPTARRIAIDQVNSTNPVLLTAWSGHGAVANTLALRELGLLEAADPQGGWLERDALGVPTGRLDEYALYGAMRRRAAAVGADAALNALRGFDTAAADLGITSVQNMATGLTPELLARVDAAGALRVRHRLIPFEMTTATGRDAVWADAKGGAALTIVSGQKWILDGTPIERLALMREPYADQPGWYGRANFPYDTLRAMVAESRRSGRQPIFHAVGDSSIALVINALRAEGPDSTWRRLRPRLEHADALMADQLDAVRALGIVVVQNPTHLTVPELAARWGAARTARVDILRDIVAARIPFALGSDGPPSPFLNVMLAALNPANPSQALTRMQGVVAYTLGSAYAEGAEKEKGVLRAGMLADLAVLSQDIFTVPLDRLPATRSVLTLVGGKPTVDRMAARPR